MTQSAHAVVVTARTFQTLVLDGSFDRPVLVDFWADWCAPCRMLMPILGKLAAEYGGRFLLAKVNTEEEQALAAQLGIRSLPTVQLFKDGQIVDQFMGAVPEQQVRALLDRHVPRASDTQLLAAEDLIAAGDFDRAGAKLAEIRRTDPDNKRLGLVEIQLTAARGQIDEALAAIATLPLDLAQDPEVAALRGQLGFAQAVTNAAPEPELAARLAANPQDSEARYQLAAYAVLRGDHAAGLEQLFELLKRDRSFRDDAGRKGMLAVFELLGGSGDLVARYRAKMMSALY